MRVEVFECPFKHCRHDFAGLWSPGCRHAAGGRFVYGCRSGVAWAAGAPGSGLRRRARRTRPALIEYLLNKLNRDEALGLTRDNLMVVAGSTSAVDMIARLYAGRHGVVLVEAPTYHDALQVFRDHGADLRGVPVDEYGLIVGALEAQLVALEREGRSPRLLYTIPNFQNPAGVTLTAARRGAIKSWRASNVF